MKFFKPYISALGYFLVSFLLTSSLLIGPCLAQTSTNQQITTTPTVWGPMTLTLNASSQTQVFTLPGSNSVMLRISGTCNDTNSNSITFSNSPDTNGTGVPTALLFKAGVGSLGRSTINCTGALSGTYRIVSGGQQVSVTTSSTFVGSITIVAFATQNDTAVFINGPVHTGEEEALRAGRAWVVTTQMQSVNNNNNLIATLSNPSNSGVNIFVTERVFSCNGATATTPQEWYTVANPTTVPTTVVALVNRKPGDANIPTGVFRWQMSTGTLAGGVVADSGAVQTGGGYDPIRYPSMLVPGVTGGVVIGGAGGGLSAAARCKVTYYGYDELIN